MICCDLAERTQRATANCIHISPKSTTEIVPSCHGRQGARQAQYPVMRFQFREPPTTLWAKRQGFVNFDWISYLQSHCNGHEYTTKTLALTNVYIDYKFRH